MWEGAVRLLLSPIGYPPSWTLIELRTHWDLAGLLPRGPTVRVCVCVRVYVRVCARVCVCVGGGGGEGGGRGVLPLGPSGVSSVDPIEWASVPEVE